MRKKIRTACGLHRFGGGYRYMWTIDRDGTEIQGIGAEALYREAQSGDDVTVQICSIRSGNFLATETVSL